MKTVTTSTSVPTESRERTKIGSVDVNDRISTPNYRHINFGLKDVAAASRHWKYFFVKLQCINGKFSIEFRRNDMLPVSLNPWPETFTKDTWGDYIRICVGALEHVEAERLREFLLGLSAVDRDAMEALLADLPPCMRKALAPLPEATNWESGLAALDATVEAVLNQPASAA